jgi:GNAT superfamily N-acetyltransferase
LIREAAVSDIPEIARLGEAFHTQAGWDEIPYSVEDCAASLEAFMQADCFVCLVAEHEGRIVGMAAGVLSPVYFNRDHLSGEELFWWVAEEAPQFAGIRLLDALENHARERGCQTWQMKALARLNGERMLRLYERRGYRAAEQIFIKRL